VVAGRRHRLLDRLERRSTVQESDAPPRLAFVAVEAVQLVACRDARFAPAARVEVDLERELLTRSRLFDGEKIPIVTRSGSESVRFVAL
jgi:hypothetical protein